MQQSNNMMFSEKNLEYNSFDKLNSIHNLNKKTFQDYSLFGYKKDTITDDLHDYRSLIFYNNKLLSYSPPKSISYELFKTSYTNFDENINIELFVEGTMIMLYFNKDKELWETSTRGNIGANTAFFQNKSQKTFRNMFDETCNISFLDVNKLDKDLCYTFVMNHPDNRIVTKCDIPELYLVKVYKILNNEENNTFQVFVLNNIDEIKENFVNTLVKFPNTKINSNVVLNNNLSYSSIEDYCKNLNFNIMGIVLYDKQRDIRTKIRNSKYEYVRKLRGNQPKLDYRYLELKKNKNINKYLQYFPEHKDNFDEYWEKTKDFTVDLYNHYVDTHITKIKNIATIPKEFKPHVYNIHQYYLNDLRPNKFTVQRSHVISYVNHLPEAMLLYALNYSKNHSLNLSIKIPENELIDNQDVPGAPRSNRSTSKSFEEIDDTI